MALKANKLSLGQIWPKKVTLVPLTPTSTLPSVAFVTSIMLYNDVRTRPDFPRTIDSIFTSELAQLAAMSDDVKLFVSRLACSVFTVEEMTNANCRGGGKLGKKSLDPIRLQFVISMTIKHVAHRFKSANSSQREQEIDR